MLTTGRLPILVFGLIFAMQTMGGPAEDIFGPFGEGRTHTMFHSNPALMNTKVSTGEILQTSNQQTGSLVVNPANNPQSIEYDTVDKVQAGGLSSAIGGAAVGVNAYGRTVEQEAGSSARTSHILETFVDKSWQARFVVDLLAETRFAFKYRYRRVENKVYGSFNINPQDFTFYSGSLAGYSLGLYHESGEAYGIGIFTEPPMRGKVKIAGEQKIMTEPGVGGFNGYYRLNPTASITYFGKQWSYKRDELASSTTSPIDQRSISLQGLALEQHYFRTRQFGIGTDYQINKGFTFQGYLYKQDGVFLFDVDDVPSDNPDAETAMSYYGGGAALLYRDARFWLRFGLHQGNHKLDSLTVGSAVFGGQNIGEYKLQDRAVIIGLGYQ